MTTYVYLMRQGGATGPIKIGVARDPDGRLKNLQTGSPRTLRIIARLPFESRMEALEMERALHAKYKEFRLKGEWFKPGLFRAMRENLKAMRTEGRRRQRKVNRAINHVAPLPLHSRIQELVQERNAWREYGNAVLKLYVMRMFWPHVPASFSASS